MPQVGTEKAATKKAKSKGRTKPKAKDVLHPEYGVVLHVGDNALTAAKAKEYLGWEEGIDGDEDYLLIDEEGNKIRCAENLTNRPYVNSLAQTYKQEILRRRWRFNGESLIIGQSGATLSAQHRLTALVLAAQAWKKAPEEWPEWEDEPTIEALVVLGVHEDDETVNTIDTGKRRSLADVIYRSTLFSKMAAKDRKTVSKMTEYAVRMLWERTGAKVDAHAPVRTHSESYAFIAKHEKVLEAVKHIFEENDKDRLGKYVSPGYAAALLYLMGASKTESSEYLEARDESAVDWENWDKACDFWTLLASGDDSLANVKKAVVQLAEDNTDGMDTRVAIILKAWEAWSADKKVTPSSLELLYDKDEEGWLHLASRPYLGGIDVGPDPVVEGVAVEEEEEEDPSEEEIAAAAAETKKAKLKTLAAKSKPTTNGKRPVEGDEVWVVADDAEGHWPGTLQEIFRGPRGLRARVKVANGWPHAGKSYEVKFESVQHEKP